MGGRWLSRLSLAAAAAAGALALFAATPAWADTTVPLNPHQVGSLATAFSHDGCTDAYVPYQQAGKDVWVFVWPDTTGTLNSVTLTFDTTGGHTADLTVSLKDGNLTTDNGTLKFWAPVPAGARILSGTSQVGDPVNTDQFNVTHTCLATNTPTTTPPTGTTTAPPTGSTSTTPGTPGGSNSASPSPGPKLPVTGAPLAVILGFGALLLVAGSVLLVLRRRGIKFTS